MKKKRVILHICILLLAAVSMAAGMYICYWEEKNVFYDYTNTYNEDYEQDVYAILEYKDAQIEFSEKFGDAKKILIDNEYIGKVTVGDIEEIFSEKYYEYYSSDVYWGDYEDYEESLEYDYDDEGNRILNTLYDMNQIQMEKYRKEWNKTHSAEKKSRYEYYKAVCEYTDEYAALAEILLRASKADGVEIGDFSPSVIINESYPYVHSGMKYYVKYTLNDEPDVLTNVTDYKIFQQDEISDLTTINNGKLTQETPQYGEKDFDMPSDFCKQVDELYVAIDLNETGSHYYGIVSKINKQITKEERQKIRQNQQICFGVIAVTLVIAFILYIILMLMAGHKEKGDEPQLYETDRLWWDLEFILMIIISSCILAGFIEMIENGYYQLCAIITAVTALAAIEFIVLISESLMRRLKTKSFLKTTFVGKLWHIIKVLAKKLNQGFHNLLGNISLTWKVIAAGGATFVWQMIMIFIAYEYVVPETAAILGIIEVVVICYLVWRYFNENKIVEAGAKKIAGGELDFKIDGDMKFSRNQSLKESINNIGEGLNAAVEESVKNERMKTELITNISHDLKTPLTSIINYVDLLKTDGLDSEKAGKYLKILEQKSQRLKNLTEDLVEVSKLNSGAVALEYTKLDIVQLIRQSLGEYEEKFASRNLQIVKTIQEEPIFVMADGRKTWRLFENLYENVYKYAMAGTRVYVDVKTESGKVNVSVKNISENPLRFTADELMERFVRGDASRTTEGSGLGLSIARSIVERQDGEMRIVLDGDLFKVEVVMNLI